MKKVFIVHGFEGSPNGGWRPWLMGELEKLDIYAFALAMPTPALPICSDWVEEIKRNVDKNKEDEIYLVGHSLGVPAILRYLESSLEIENIHGAVLVSGPCKPTGNKKIENFLDKEFDFKTIKSKVQKFAVIHGDNDQNVPLNNAETLSYELNTKLIIVPNGGHLNGSSGWSTLPQCLESLTEMIL